MERAIRKVKPSARRAHTMKAELLAMLVIALLGLITIVFAI